MIKQQSQAVWRGGLKDGSGTFRSGTLEGNYSFASRFESGVGSTPEGLIGAAHAGCFSMALSLFLAEKAKQNCPVSKALAGVEIVLKSAQRGPAAAAHA